MTYAWIIDRDYIDEPDAAGDGRGVGVYGPSTRTNPDVATLYAELDYDRGEKFRMYDDDGILYYVGRIIGDYEGFEPLDDYGMPNAGCTGIKYRNEKTGAWEYL